jgi:RNA polymerase sigma-70 factor (ECF subfamily)
MSDDSGDFADFYRARFGHLVAQLYAVTGDMSEAQDCAQEAFVRAWPRWSKIQAYDNPGAWLYQVGHRVAISRWRKVKRAVTDRRGHELPMSLPEPGTDSVVLVEALRELPEAQRRAVVLHHMVGRTVAQIADDEGVAIGTIKARLSRGRTALAALLDDTTDTASTAREARHA